MQILGLMDHLFFGEVVVIGACYGGVCWIAWNSDGFSLVRDNREDSGRCDKGRNPSDESLTWNNITRRGFSSFHSALPVTIKS